MSRKLASAFLYLTIPVVAALAGGYIAPRLNDTGMGLDQIGDVMVGLATGVLAGILLAAILPRRLSDNALKRAAVVTALLTALAFGFVAMAFPVREVLSEGALPRTQVE